jgi:hypothetical protein
MKSFIQKLIQIEEEMAQEKGAFTLFALFKREEYDSLDLWDLIVCAPWAQSDQERSALSYIISKLKAAVTTDELVKLSYVGVINNNNPGLIELQENFADKQPIQHSMALVPVENFNGMDMKRAYLITLAQAHSAA